MLGGVWVVCLGGVFGWCVGWCLGVLSVLSRVCWVCLGVFSRVCLGVFSRVCWVVFGCVECVCVCWVC